MERLTIPEYLERFSLVTDRKLRTVLKSWAFAALYSGDPDATILLPLGMLPFKEPTNG